MKTRLRSAGTRDGPLSELFVNHPEGKIRQGIAVLVERPKKMKPLAWCSPARLSGPRWAARQRRSRERGTESEREREREIKGGGEREREKAIDA